MRPLDRLAPFVVIVLLGVVVVGQVVVHRQTHPAPPRNAEPACFPNPPRPSRTPDSPPRRPRPSPQEMAGRGVVAMSREGC
ncbi:hypothetical protein [Streptomyces sp. NPDC005799]|uniref:hypothetical protein n=1 Tax=Streptomyces sp. NPDC005799 TaxID=3154678 RepID=UPI0033F0B7E1